MVEMKLTETITQAFENAKVNAKTMNREFVKKELDRLQEKYVQVTSDFVSYPYSVKLYTTLIPELEEKEKEAKLKFDSEKKWGAKDALEKIYNDIRNSKVAQENTFKNLQTNREKFWEWKAYFEEMILCWQKILEQCPE